MAGCGAALHAKFNVRYGPGRIMSENAQSGKRQLRVQCNKSCIALRRRSITD